MLQKLLFSSKGYEYLNNLFVVYYRLCDTASHSQLSFVRSQYCCFQEVALALYSEVTPLGNAIVINKEDTGQ